MISLTDRVTFKNRFSSNVNNISNGVRGLGIQTVCYKYRIASRLIQRTLKLMLPSHRVTKNSIYTTSYVLIMPEEQLCVPRLI